MAKTRDQIRTAFGKYTRNSSTTNLDYGEDLVNDLTRQLVGGYDWPFLEATTTETTVADQQFYTLNVDVDKIRTVTVTVGSTNYPVMEAPSTEFWNNLNVQTYDADIPQYYIFRNGQVGLFPTPSTAGNTINIDYKQKVLDLDTADYTTGTVTVTNDDATVTGSGTTFTAAMVGRYFQADDGYWYKIASFTSTTSIELDTPYQGTTASGASYTIAQTSIFPDGFELLPIYMAVSDYFLGQEEKQTVSDRFKLRAEDLERRLRREWGNKTTRVGLSRMDAPLDNPNLFFNL